MAKEIQLNRKVMVLRTSAAVNQKKKKKNTTTVDIVFVDVGRTFIYRFVETRN